jgi:hypothetical protein
MVLLYLSKEFGGVGFRCVRAWGHWGTSPTEKTFPKIGIYFIFYDFLGHSLVAS